jgi:phenylalanyl-tRNA synthetase alpha subunit
MEKIGKIREKLLKTENYIKTDFAKVEKIKAEGLKRTEEMRSSMEKDIARMEAEILKSKDLAQESLPRLKAEITTMREEVQQKYEDLKSRISAAIVPR